MAEAAEEGVGEVGGEALEGPLLPPPCLHALLARARGFDAEIHERCSRFLLADSIFFHFFFLR